MNPDQPSREQIEARITALLLGELPGEEAALLRYTIAQDPALAKLQEQLQSTLPLVREAVQSAESSESGQSPRLSPSATAEVASWETAASLKLSAERRQRLLEHFKTPRPKPEPLFWLKPINIPGMPRLVEVLVVVGVLALVAAMLLPALSKAKSRAMRPRTQMISVNRTYSANFAEANSSAPSPASAQPENGSQTSLATIESIKLMPPVVAPPPPEPGQGQVAAKNLTLNMPSVVKVQPASPLAPPPAGLPQQIFLPQSEAQSEAVDRSQVAGERAKIRGVSAAANISALAQSSQGSSSASTVGQPAFAFNGGAQNQWQVPADESESGNKRAQLGMSKSDSDGARMFLSITPTDTPQPGTIKPGTLASRIAGASGASGGGDGTATPPAAGMTVFAGRMMPMRATANSTPTLAMNDDGNGGRYDSLAGNGVQSPKAETAVVNHFYRLNGDVATSPSSASQGEANAVSQDSAALAPTPTMDSQQLQAINQLMVNRKTAYDKEAAQLRDLKSLEETNMSQAAEVLPQMVQDTELNALLAKRAEARRNLANSTDPNIVRQQKSLIQDLNGEIDSRTTDIVGGLESQVNSQKAALETLTASVEAKADKPVRKPAPNAPVPQPEILTRVNSFSTFALNVSDASFKLAEAALQNGVMPDPASIRSEEFINAFDYRDPEAAPGQPLAFASERARDPFAHNRELLRFAVKAAATGRQPGRALNLVLLLDISGSMERSDRVAIIHEALHVLAGQLQPQDTVSVVTFARTARLWADGVSGDKAGETLDRVGGITPEGGTNLEEALRLAYEAAHRHYRAGGMNRVVLLTDGAANLGNVEPAALKRTVDAQRRQGIALDCFGIGWEDYNDDLLEQLSSNGDGRYAFLNSPEDVAKDFAAKLAGALEIAAADVKVQVEFNPQRVVAYRQIGYATHQLTKEQFRDNTVAAGQIAAQESGNALYAIQVNPAGAGPVATVHVRYKVPGTEDYRERSWDVDYTGTAPAMDQSSAAMRLAATASAFSEWLANSPYAQTVTLDELLKNLRGVPEIYGADDRPKQLETMIQEARRLQGK